MNRIVTEAIGDHRTGMRKFHVKTKLSSDNVMSEYLDDENNNNTLTSAGELVLARLFAIDGVERITIDRFSISVIVGSAFDYESDGITAQIVNLLALELGYDEFEFERRDNAWPYDMYDNDGSIIRQEAKYQDNHEKRLCKGHFA